MFLFPSEYDERKRGKTENRLGVNPPGEEKTSVIDLRVFDLRGRWGGQLNVPFVHLKTNSYADDVMEASGEAAADASSSNSD